MSDSTDESGGRVCLICGSDGWDNCERDCPEGYTDG